LVSQIYLTLLALMLEMYPSNMDTSAYRRRRLWLIEASTIAVVYKFSYSSIRRVLSSSMLAILSVEHFILQI